jgi:large subunit ribosomal protein L9
MAKRLQVVLNKTVTKLGQLGDLVEVAPGYARNYLLPQGLATLATPGILKQVEFRKAKEAARLQALKEEALTLKAALEKVGRFVVRKQVGEAEAIFGTVTTQDVADSIKENARQEIDRRSVTIPDIGKIGEYAAQIKLHPEVMAEVVIEVASL